MLSPCMKASRFFFTSTFKSFGMEAFDSVLANDGKFWDKSANTDSLEKRISSSRVGTNSDKTKLLF